MNIDELARQSTQSARGAVAHLQPSSTPPNRYATGAIITTVALAGAVGMCVIGIDRSGDTETVETASTAPTTDSSETETPNQELIWHSNGTSMVPALKELGIADSFVFGTSKSSDDLDVIVGEANGQLCLLVHGEHNFGRCTSDNIIVAEQLETDSGNLRFVATQLPHCVSQWNIAFFGGATAEQFPWTAGFPDKRLDNGFVAAQVDQATKDWQLLGYAPDLFVAVDLPSGNSTTNWPADMCAGLPDYSPLPSGSEAVNPSVERIEARVRNNKAAQELGIVESFDFILELNSQFDPDYLFGQADNRLCLLVADPIDVAQCRDGDIVVVTPVDSGADIRTVVMARLPACLSTQKDLTLSILGIAPDPIVSAIFNSPDESYALLSAGGYTDNWRLLIESDSLFLTIQLPDDSRDVFWPEDVCELTGVVRR